MEFSRQKHWSGLPCPLQRDLPEPGIKPCILCLLHWQVGSLPLAPPGKPLLKNGLVLIFSSLRADANAVYCDGQQHGFWWRRTGVQPWICHLVAVPQFTQLWSEADNSTLQDIVRIKCVHVHKVFRTVANTWSMLYKCRLILYKHYGYRSSKMILSNFSLHVDRCNYCLI